MTCSPSSVPVFPESHQGSSCHCQDGHPALGYEAIQANGAHPLRRMAKGMEYNVPYGFLGAVMDGRRRYKG